MNTSLKTNLKLIGTGLLLGGIGAPVALTATHAEPDSVFLGAAMYAVGALCFIALLALGTYKTFGMVGLKIFGVATLIASVFLAPVFRDYVRVLAVADALVKSEQVNDDAEAKALDDARDDMVETLKESLPETSIANLREVNDIVERYGLSVRASKMADDHYRYYVRNAQGRVVATIDGPMA